MRTILFAAVCALEAVFLAKGPLVVQDAVRFYFRAMVVQDAVANGADSCMLAMRAPTVSRTGDDTLDKQLEEQRSALIGIINMSPRRPDLCMATCLVLIEGKIATSIADRSELSNSYICIVDSQRVSVP